MKYHLIQGLHIAIIANISAGFGGSLFAQETLTVCKKLGIPAILVTFDYHRYYPDIGHIRRLELPDRGALDRDRHKALDDLLEVFNEARANNKFVVIDVPVGITMNNSMLSLIRNRCIQNVSSIAALVPIMAGESTGAEMALRAFTSLGIHCDRGLIRRFTHPGDPTSTNLSRLPAYPVWCPKYTSRATMELINQEIERVCNPTLNHLPRLHELRHSQLLTKSKSGPIAEAIEHFDLAKKAIYRAILAPITNMIP